eukprot:TRINITY_DN9901_c0_g1_i1.p1 TRINITY_DN9901_c0_g1~~TRINITY_DN9901_c0_g1_i1.p1  ORF type:complete len:257 (-),score=30.99 TRINITY_DN9901_c0_g1_i1:104-874(-)
MVAVAQMAREFGLKFTYLTKPLSKYLRNNPSGNYLFSIELGMETVFTSQNLDEILLEYHNDPTALVIPRGGYFKEAEFGISILAEELNSFICSGQLGNTEDVAIVVPSGTGITAFYLSKWFHQKEKEALNWSLDRVPRKVSVYSVPVSMCRHQMETEFERMNNQHTGNRDESRGLPVVLDTRKNYRFGEPHPLFLKIYRFMKEKKQVEFDLIYAPKTWRAIFENRKLIKERNLIYIHTGGISGNVSQLRRYENLRS